MTIADLWDQTVSAFLLSPSQFLATSTSENFLAELLHELRNDKANDQLKILLVSVLLEHPTILCPSSSVGEETALELLSVFSHTPQKSIILKSNVMLAITNVIICTTCLANHTKMAENWLDLLFQMIQDTNDYRCGLSQQPLRATACECLREMETCSPGLLSQKLEALYLLKQQETTVLHQSYCMLYTLGLKNAIRILTSQKDVTDLEFKSILGGNEGFVWKSNQLRLTLLPINMMVQVPRLPPGLDCKELKSIMSSLLEESYLQTPISQSALLRELVEIVAMVPGLSPTLFKSQLLRLFGTADVSLMHATLFMKDTFTDSLFSAEDENFLLKRLVGTAQHPLLRVPEKLFYMECILHFPENRPISSSGEESLPVLVTPRLAVSLHPTVFNDSATMLCRLNLLCLVHLEADEGEADKGISYLFEHIMALLKIIDNDGSREVVVTSFRALFIFLMHFSGMEELSEKMRRCRDFSMGTEPNPSWLPYTSPPRGYTFWMKAKREHLESDGNELPRSLQELNTRIKRGKRAKQKLWEEMACRLTAKFGLVFSPAKVADPCRWLQRPEVLGAGGGTGTAIKRMGGLSRELCRGYTDTRHTCRLRGTRAPANQLVDVIQDSEQASQTRHG
ncbi:AP-5 complex subunit beta-1-like [Sinocyclocheilus grahami]|uniref:AP-5 complex subunit beta-1-like n=1 Tax=Sinocyclocheilus grahami TaxID=75366 RepID=UPI0007ACFE66|nr:PREDICTED: AP-5 complex subunit beta-1-like [Sinocyclocheilus grahami]